MAAHLQTAQVRAGAAPRWLPRVAMATGRLTCWGGRGGLGGPDGASGPPGTRAVGQQASPKTPGGPSLG